MLLPPLQSIERILAENIPIVLANIDTLVPIMDQVMVNNHQGGYLAGQYLLHLNHRRMGCITFSQPLSYVTSRIVGFRQALAEVGIELTTENFATGNGPYECGYKTMQERHLRHPDLTHV